MSGWVAVLFWWVAFAGSHMVLSSIGVRRPLIARLGERGFQGLYSLVAFATLIPLVMTWWGDRHGGPLLWNLREVPGLREVMIVLGVLAFALVFAGAMQQSPASLLAGSHRRAYGATRISRHAAFMGAALVALTHVVMNGWASDVVFFGGLVAFAWVGSVHQDTRKLALDDGTLAPFYEETSVLPFAAILSGRQKLVLGELPWLGIALGVAAGIALFWFHDPLVR